MCLHAETEDGEEEYAVKTNNMKWETRTYSNQFRLFHGLLFSIFDNIHTLPTFNQIKFI